MAALEAGRVATGSLVAATLETAGTRLQSRMLDLVNSGQGQELAGLLFLIAVVTAVLTVAIGGNYKWARYLLVGPPLFFFLTQIRVASDGAQWKFGDADFPDLRQRMLKGVMDFDAGNGQGNDVALFFQFWNVFMSDVTQELIKLPNVTEDESHMSFVTKIERYMGFWDSNFITDESLRAFIRITMISECADFYMYQKMVADPHVNDGMKQKYREIIAEREKVKVTAAPDIRSRQQNDIFADLINRGILTAHGTYTCKELWELVVKALREHIQKAITDELNTQLATGQTGSATMATFIRKVRTETSRATSMTRLEDELGVNGDFTQDPAFQQGLLNAIDWVVARSLWHEIWDRNPYAESFNFEGRSGNRATGMGEQTIVSDQVATTSNAIQQFNRTEMYQFKGDYVNAALSMPHFQGVLLMLLAAVYPFFAMAVVVPGRAGAILLWMGLWAWVKLWDFGFAVVMMIDNILYALFPRGPNLEGNQVMDPGIAWVRIMEIDPNYSSATYYNLIATCMYAVPLAMGLLVKKGGSELINAVHGAWHGQATRLAGSAASFARSLQAQSYARRAHQESLNRTIKAVWGEFFNKDGFQKHLKEFMQLAGMRAGVNASSTITQDQLNKLGMGDKKEFVGQSGKVLDALIGERMSMLQRQMGADFKLAGQKAHYDYMNSNSGYWASESAVAARYYSHDFSPSFYPGKQALDAEYSRQFYNPQSIAQPAANGLTGASFQSLPSVFGGGVKK